MRVGVGTIPGPGPAGVGGGSVIVVFLLFVPLNVVPALDLGPGALF